MGVSLRWEECCSAHQIWVPRSSWRISNQANRTLPKDAFKKIFLMFFLNCWSGVTPHVSKPKINLRTECSLYGVSYAFIWECVPWNTKQTTVIIPTVTFLAGSNNCWSVEVSQLDCGPRTYLRVMPKRGTCATGAVSGSQVKEDSSVNYGRLSDRFRFEDLRSSSQCILPLLPRNMWAPTSGGYHHL